MLIKRLEVSMVRMLSIRGSFKCLEVSMILAIKRLKVFVLVWNNFFGSLKMYKVPITVHVKAATKCLEVSMVLAIKRLKAARVSIISA